MMTWPPTWDQLKGIVERLVAIALAWAVVKGWINVEAAKDYGPIIIMLASALYAWRINRPKAIIQSAAAIPGTAVVTTPAIANSTPELNIVSAATNVVVPKTTAGT